ncbi:ankyrin repeat domain-containing protein 12 [Caerostris extrusa]|uniref:Ankyrin repeat domain-containing protein 12 n=1 Tax=Caerostris extrusa TaxID=172846 RepID=A0AAV4NJ51_CAEEX|nr:ankyrin repeat domain-containing protein 12 [Caerostris extrusa]
MAYESSPNREDNETSSLKRNDRGETPLHLASKRGDFQRVKNLLKEGVDVNAVDNAGWTSLHEASNYGRFQVAKLLLEYGANVHAVGLNKFTPLHDAAVNQHEKIVSLLLNYGADPLQENADHKTPFDVARSEGVAEILRKAIQDKKSEQKQKNLIEESPSKKYTLGSSEAGEKRQSEKSPCQSISALCELTMRKNSPQNQTHKGAEKPTSPRLTLRFQSIRSRDDKSSSSAKVNDISSVQPKYQSYCVTMETKGDVYDFRKEDATVSSTQCVSSTSENEETGNKCEAVTSTCKEMEMEVDSENEKKQEEITESEKPAPVEKMDTSDNVTSKVNGSRLSIDSNLKDRECTSDAEKEKEEVRRKRRKSSDSSQSKHSASKGHKSPSGKNSQQETHNDQRSPKNRKRGSQSSSDTESNPSDLEIHSNETGADTTNAFNGPSTSVGPHSPKVPPLKIVIPSGSGSLELETRERSKVSSSKQALPYVVNTTTAETVDTNTEPVSGSFASENNRETTKSETPSKKEDTHPPEERFQRVTRSSQRMQAAMSGGTSSTQCQNSESSSNSNVVSSSSQKAEGSGESSNDEQMQMHIDVHPRKRKIRTKESGNESSAQNASSASSSNEDPQQQQQHQQLNSYQMFLNIRKQVDKRRKGMFVVHPKVPEGFKDFLINRCSYVLEGNPSSRLSVPMISSPQSLDGSIKELFDTQEKERYRLRLQHLIEREKLILSVEQEILRVHGQAARAMANQTVPLSVCSILKDEEIYNVLEDDKDKNVRTRFNGRMFTSWLQDVDDKWKKLRYDAMLLRHHNEAESLHAVQKLAWGWKMKELAMCDMKSSPVVEDIFVPIVHVSDDFKLASGVCQ